MARRGDNIYHRKDGRWEGRFVKGRVDAHTRYGYVFGKTYREAKEKLTAARYEWQVRTEEAERAKATLRSISTLWLKDSEAFLKASTLAKYRDYLRCYILTEFGDRNMDGISNSAVTTFCYGLLSSGGSESQGLPRKRCPRYSG